MGYPPWVALSKKLWISSEVPSFEAALRIFDERFRVYQYLLKRDQTDIPHREYSNPVVQKAIQNRVAYLQRKSE
jgi:hypothetical protein